MEIKIYAQRKWFASLLCVEQQNEAFFLITQWGGNPKLSEKRKMIWEQERFVKERGKNDIGDDD